MFIQECIEGFLSQICDFRVEIIVHDDASTDGTTEILKDYADRYPSMITLITQVENQFSKGVNPYYNYVFPRVKGEFIAICDGDDYWINPHKLMLQKSILEGDPGIVIAYGRVNLIKNDQLIENVKNGIEKDLSPSDLKRGHGINTLTAFFRNVFESKTPVWMNYSPIGDLTVWAILGYHGRGVFIDDAPLAVYRMHNGGILSQKKETHQKFMTVIALMCIAMYHYEKGDIESSKSCIVRVLIFLIGFIGTLATISNIHPILIKLRKKIIFGSLQRGDQ
jgi:glycosyltransferase involved in cell wall biosynthesis